MPRGTGPKELACKMIRNRRRQLSLGSPRLLGRPGAAAQHYRDGWACERSGNSIHNSCEVSQETRGAVTVLPHIPSGLQSLRASSSRRGRPQKPRLIMFLKDEPTALAERCWHSSDKDMCCTSTKRGCVPRNACSYWPEWLPYLHASLTKRNRDGQVSHDRL